MKKVLLVLVTLVIAGITVTAVFANSGVGQEKAEEARQKYTEQLMKVKGVVGVGLGKGEVVVMVENENHGNLPDHVDNVPIRKLTTGKLTINCHKGWAHGKHGCVPTPTPTTIPPGPGTGNCPDTRATYRPACIGISTGHVDITACSIGGKLTDGVNTYALSNNHCYANSNLASIGDTVLQRGVFDGGSSPADDFGTLHAYKPIDYSGNNVIDAAIALVNDADLISGTPADGYGSHTSTPVLDFVGQTVLKYGRTTEQTVGTVDAVNATTTITGYAGGDGDATFVDQIIIVPGSFGAGGDSGSLVVDTNRNPVGLYYAGSIFVGIANPIQPVLDEFGVTFIP